MSPPCRGCAAPTQRLIDLGRLPLVDQFPLVGTDPAADPLYPLALAMCGTCGLLQIEDCPPPGLLFDGEYRYLSSSSDAWVAAARDFAQSQTLSPGATVVEIAANDGYQLKWFHAAGHRAIGVDPAPIPVARARAAGLDMREAFFDLDLAGALQEETGGADLIIAKNVLAHVPHPGALLRAIHLLLRDDGRCVIEVPWLGDLVTGNAIDTIYHEHHCVFSLGALSFLAARAGLAVADVAQLPFHGGSLRVTLAKAEWVTALPDAARALLHAEARLGLSQPGRMAQALRVARDGLQHVRAALEDEIAAGHGLVAYGAAAKGVVLLSLAGLMDMPFAYVVDRNPEKHGRRIPGSTIPIVSPDCLAIDRPATCLVLSWNWIDEIAEQQAGYLSNGGRLLVPLPALRWW